MVTETLRRFGHIDLLVNDAGIIHVAPIDALSLADFHRAMDINFWGTVNAALAVLPEMRARKSGRIVNITSIGGKVAVPHLLPYDCPKFAAVGFSEGLGAELTRAGVNVTTVVPGLMRTGSHRFAEFRGKPAAEHAWFRLAAVTPGLSMSAQRAARRIVGRETTETGNCHRRTGEGLASVQGAFSDTGAARTVRRQPAASEGEND